MSAHLEKNTYEKLQEIRQLRLVLQDASAKILKGFYLEKIINKNGYEKQHRTCTCNRFTLANDVGIVKSEKHGKAFFSGLETCANAKTCPVCAAAINERKANEMRLAMNQAEAMDLSVSLMTFTVPHSVGDSICNLLPQISAALSGFWAGAPAGRFKKKYGIEGNIRAFETRDGENGWHPHFHLLIFSKEPLPTTNIEFVNNRRKVLPLDEQSEEWRWILERWKTVCKKAGLKKPNLHGLDIQNGSMAGEYVSKFGSDSEILKTKKGIDLTWDMADEMTKGCTKKGASFSPWDLLARSVDENLTEKERKRSASRFLEYARATKGVNTLRWSKGLRSLFGLSEKELTDEEILQREEDKASYLCTIEKEEWREILRNKKRGQLLDIAEEVGAKGVAAYLYGLNCNEGKYQSFSDYLAVFVQRRQVNFTAEEKQQIAKLRVGERHERELTNYFKESVVV